MMRFYGMSFAAVRQMPIRAFWLLNDMIDRVRAEEVLEILPAHSVAMGGEHVKRIVKGLHSRLGRPQIVEKVTMSDEDIRKARRLFGAHGTE
ncbi:hypothetical protein ACW7BC_06405 [Azospirillum argentinense]